MLGITSCLGTHYFEPEVGEAFKAFKYVVEIEGASGKQCSVQFRKDAKNSDLNMKRLLIILLANAIRFHAAKSTADTCVF